MIEGRSQFLKAKGAVEDGSERMLGNGAGHRLEAVARADCDPLKPDLPRDDQAELCLNGGPGQYANHGKCSARTDGSQRLWQGCGTTEFDDVVDPLATGPLPHGAIPLGLGVVVQSCICAKLPCSFQLYVASGDHENPRSTQSREL